MNDRQNAYRSAQSILSLLAQHGSDCPLCFRTCYAGRSEGRPIVCPRCRGFGRVLDIKVSLGFISNISDRAQALTDYLVAKTDCPT